MGAEQAVKKEKKSFFDSKVMRTKIKSANVTLFPEAFFGYLGGPFFALIPNAIVNTFLTQYWKNVLGLNEWAEMFTWLMPLISTIVIIIGNLLVGKLMEGKPRKAGKARPILVLSIPLILVALICLFLAPYPYVQDASGNWVLSDNTFWTLFVCTLGYNLFYAFAWPMYYTAHSSIVNLATRNSSQRSLLATLANAAQSGAAGMAGMLGGYFADWLDLLPSAENKDYWINIVYDADGKTVKSYDVDYDLLNTARSSANGRWMIMMIVMLVLLTIGVLLEYFFTRERVTEEQFASLKKGDTSVAQPKKVPMKEQIKVCTHDSNWWIMMSFWVLYQLGGMLKNNGQMFYSQAWTGGTSLSSTISIAGAVPTIIGMLIAWPLANKFTKTKSIQWGALLAAIFGFVGLIPIFIPSLLNGDPSEVTGAVTGISIAGFCLKAIGTVPAIYISMGLMADVLDHQEAVYGIRTDGFTMAVYGSIMIAMTGISNAIILGVDGACGGNLQALRIAMTCLFFGGEMLCYLVIFLMFFGLKSEFFSKFDHEAIVEDQKAKCEHEGIEYVAPEERIKEEQAQADVEAEEARVAELKATCEKKGLNFDEENKKYLDKKAENDKKAADKKAASEAKKAQKAAEKQAKYDALSQEQKDALAKKQADKKAKQDAYDAKVKAEFDKIRLDHKEEREARLFA